MGVPTKVQLIQRKDGQQWYINFPSAMAQAMEFQRGEILAWIVEDTNRLLLVVARSPQRRLKKPNAGRRDGLSLLLDQSAASRAPAMNPVRPILKSLLLDLPAPTSFFLPARPAKSAGLLLYESPRDVPSNSLRSSDERHPVARHSEGSGKSRRCPKEGIEH